MYLHLNPKCVESCCRDWCLFLQLVSHTCACTEGLGGGQAQRMLSLWEEEINTKVSLSNYSYLTHPVSQLTLWGRERKGDAVVAV